MIWLFGGLQLKNPMFTIHPISNVRFPPLRNSNEIWMEKEMEKESGWFIWRVYFLRWLDVTILKVRT